MFKYLKLHFKTIVKAQKKAVDIPNYRMIKDLPIAFEVTGQSAASNPQMLAAKIQAFLAALAQPIQLPPNSPYDVNKIIFFFLKSLNMPFGPKSLMKDILQSPDEQVKAAVQALSDAGYTPDQIQAIIGEAKLVAMEAAAGVQPGGAMVPSDHLHPQGQPALGAGQQPANGPSLNGQPNPSPSLPPGGPGQISAQPQIAPAGLGGPNEAPTGATGMGLPEAPSINGAG
jgi:hypothetical protein